MQKNVRVSSEILEPDIDPLSMQLNARLPCSDSCLVLNIDELQQYGRHRPCGEVDMVLWK